MPLLTFIAVNEFVFYELQRTKSHTIEDKAAFDYIYSIFQVFS